MSINSVSNDLASTVNFINAQKPLPPTISGYSVGGVDDTALDPAGGQTVQINGTGFLAGATITFDGNAVAVVTFVNANQLTFTSPAKSAGTYTIYVVNADGGTAIYIPGIIYSVLPTWTTAAGTLGSYYETTSISNTVVASGDAPITYSLFSGSLPTGSTLYANGVITGTAPVDSSSTTYSFTIQASDAQLQDSTRSFSLTINVDAVTWVSPANATTYSSAVDSAISTVTLSATDAAGYAVSYSANALPTGLSLSGANITGTPTVIADSSTLLTATAATTNRTATRTINWSITVANDPYFEYNTLLIPGASTTFVDDASTNNFAVTINGDTKPNNFNPYTPGYYSNYFDGNGDYLTVPSSANFTLPGDFTIECWIYVPSVSQTIQRIFSSNAGPSGGCFFSVGNDIGTGAGAGKLCANGHLVSPYTSGLITAPTAIPTNTWIHAALVRSGSTITIYQNGVSVASATDSATWDFNNGAGVRISGTPWAGTAEDFGGYISNLRVVKGTAVYTSNFTPSTTPLTAIANTSLLTCQSNRFIDNSTNTFAITVFGNTSISSFDPFVPNSSYSTYGSGYFDGTGDTITYTDSNNNLDLGGIVASLEMWVYPTAATNYSHVFGKYGSTWGWSTSNGIEYAIAYQPAGFYLVYNNAGNAAFVTDPTARSINQWYHVAVASDASNNLSLFINGTRVATTTATITKPTTRTSIIQGANSNGSETFAGYITDTRFISGTGAYSASSSTITVPAVPLTAITNTQLLTLQNNQSVNNNVFLDNSTNNFLVTRNGNTTQGTFSPYGPNWSNYFDGTGDYLTTPASTILDVGNTSWTIECWVYMNNTTGTQMIVGYNNLSPSDFWDLTVVSGVPTFKRRIGSSEVAVSGGTISANVFTHVAVVRNGTAVTLYLNGSSVATNANLSMPTSMSDQILGIGANRYSAGYDYYFNGFISNLRMVKGTAVYTAAFTPSTTPLTAITNTSLLTCQSNRLIDNSINNFTITKNGDTSVQRFSPFNPSSLTPTSYSGYFDGSGDYLSAASSSAFNVGTNSFCIEFWIYTSGFPSGGVADGIVSAGYSTNVHVLGFNVTGFRFYVVGSFVDSTTAINLNAWNHVAFVRNGTTGTIYVNGVASGTGTLSGTGANSALYVGTSSHDLTETFTGYLSNVRFVNGSAVYTSNFTPPTSPLTAIANTSLLTLQSTTFIDNSTNNFTISAFGNSQPSIQNPFGFTSATTEGYTVSTIGGSGYFDGTGDNLAIPYSANFTMTGDFTAECWVYVTSSPNSYAGILAFSNDSEGVGWNILIGGNTSKFHFNVAMTYIDTVTSMTLNAWTHLALVRSGSTGKLYINGVADANTVTTSATATCPTNPLIGSYPLISARAFNGYISNIRVIKGTAVYTSNFVPPSAPVVALQNSSLLLDMTSAGIYDASMLNNLETVGNAKLSTAVAKFGGSSMNFDGSSTCTILANPALTFGTSDFTIEMWVYSASQSSTGNRTIGNGAGAGWGANKWIFTTTTPGNANKFTWQFWNYNSGGADLLVSSSASNNSTWTYVAITRSGNTFRMFVNGVIEATASSSASVDGNIPIQLTLGNSGIAGDSNWTGYLDDLRVTKGYARYTTNFAPPTSAFPIY